jgi:hypothetical protein
MIIQFDWPPVVLSCPWRPFGWLNTSIIITGDFFQLLFYITGRALYSTMHLPFNIELDVVRRRQEGQSRNLRHSQVTHNRFEDHWVPVFDYSYDLIISTRPGVRNSNSTITAFLSSYIKYQYCHQAWCLLKTHNLKVVFDVSIGCRIMLVKNLWTERGFLNGHDGK